MNIVFAVLIRYTALYERTVDRRDGDPTSTDSLRIRNTGISVGRASPNDDVSMRVPVHRKETIHLNSVPLVVVNLGIFDQNGVISSFAGPGANANTDAPKLMHLDVTDANAR